MKSDRKGWRGYVASRPVLGQRTAQHVQNIVIRDHCRRHGLHYLLGAVEYTMPACYMMLEDIVAEMPRLEGMVAYSLFMLPADAARRRLFWDRMLACNARFHAALEDMIVADADDIARAEDLILVKTYLHQVGIA
jgi:sporadic carbohydrate cluster protein (TIGR04323 family)